MISTKMIITFIRLKSAQASDIEVLQNEVEELQCHLFGFAICRNETKCSTIDRSQQISSV